MKLKIIEEIICGLLILLYLYTASSKIIGFKDFEGNMYNQPLPHWFASLLIWTLPIIEIIIAICLIINNTRKLALWSSLILMVSFTIYVGLVMLHTFSRIPCACAGVIKSLSWQQHLLFNIFFTLLSIIGIVLQVRTGWNDEYNRKQSLQ